MENGQGELIWVAQKLVADCGERVSGGCSNDLGKLVGKPSGVRLGTTSQPFEQKPDPCIGFSLKEIRIDEEAFDQDVSREAIQNAAHFRPHPAA